MQGSNCLSPNRTHISEKGESSHQGQEVAFKVNYDQLHTLRPITHQFARDIGFLPITSFLPHKPTKKETTQRAVFVSSVEELVSATLEVLDEPFEGDIPPPTGENLDGDGEEFHFSDEEQLKEETNPHNNEDLNGEGEESSNS